MVKASDEIVAALEASEGGPVSIEVPGSERNYLVVDSDVFRQLQLESNRKAIDDAIVEMKAGDYRPAVDVFNDLRAELLRRKECEESPGGDGVEG